MALTGVFPKTSTEFVPRGPLELVKCFGDKRKACGLVQLRHSFNPDILFGESYGYRSGLNGTMQRHLQDLAENLNRFVQLKPTDTIVDIGSNDGTFLGFFCGQKLNLIGVDPLAGKFKKYYHKEIITISEFFSKESLKASLGNKKVKVISAFAVFYDCHDPVRFFSDIKDVLCDDGLFLLEQGYLPCMLKNGAYDAICHEHVAYYGLKQIKKLTEMVGFKIVDCRLNQVNGGSLSLILAKKESSLVEAKAGINQLLENEKKLRLDTLAPFQNFTKRAFEHKELFFKMVRGLSAQGLKVAVYGASTKGNVLLQFCQFSSKEIMFIAEINSDKWGRFSPGSKIPIISEKEAKKAKPDIFIVLPWHLKEHILLKEKSSIKSGISFLFPFQIKQT